MLQAIWDWFNKDYEKEARFHSPFPFQLDMMGFSYKEIAALESLARQSGLWFNIGGEDIRQIVSDPEKAQRLINLAHEEYKTLSEHMGEDRLSQWITSTSPNKYQWNK